MFRVFLGLFSSVVILSTSANPVHGAFLTGDPSTADGWTRSGNSLSNGIYAGGSANFSFDVYRGSQTFQSSSGLGGTVPGWMTGDLIVGMGGVIVNTPPMGWSGPTTGPAPNANLGDNVRIVSKFGSPSASFSASTTPPIPGNGNRSFSGGFGGVGGVLLTTNANTLAAANAANAGQLQTPDSGFVWDGVVNTNGVTLTSSQVQDISRYIYTVDGTNQYLSTWQLALNVTALQRLNLGYATPDAGTIYDQALQVGGGSSTDALVLTTPLPPTLLLAVGAFAIGIITRRRL